MNPTSSATARKVAPGSWRAPRTRLTLLQQMAQDAEKLDAQSARLRELKEFAGVTFKQIADAVEVTERQVQRWFAGESEVSGTNIKTLAAFLGTTPDYIEYGVIKRQRPDVAPDLMGELSLIDRGAQLDRIESMLADVLERLVAADVLKAVEADKPTTRRPARTARPKRAA